MTYPKKLMSIEELHISCGFPRQLLYDLCRHEKAERFVVRNASKGKIFIDTEEFEKARKEICGDGRVR